MYSTTYTENDDDTLSVGLSLVLNQCQYLIHKVFSNKELNVL